MGTLQKRDISIDVMRGLTLALMIIVNMSISSELSYSQLLHANWFGFTLTDTVFPTFLFVVGASMALNSARDKKLETGAFLKKTFKRGLIIFLLGVIVSNFPFFQLVENKLVFQQFENLRILGVLQRIGICFVLASLILRFMGIKAAVFYCFIALFFYQFALLNFGDLTLENNFALKLDLMILGSSHLYKGEGIPFDPEGILGIIPSLVNLLAGYIALKFLKNGENKAKAVWIIAAVGIVLILLANILSAHFPISKKIWTSTYVLLGVGIDCLILSILVFVIDFIGLKKPNYYFEVFGKNTIFIYVFAEVLMSVLWTIPIGDKRLMMAIYNNVFAMVAPVKIASLLFSLAFMQLCWFVAYYMDKRKIYIKI